MDAGVSRALGHTEGRHEWFLRARVFMGREGKLVPILELFNSRTRETIRVRANAAAGTAKAAGVAVSLDQLSKALEGIYFTVKAEDDGE